MKNMLVIADSIDDDQTAFDKALSLAKTTVANIHVLVFCHESFGMVDEERWPEFKNMIMERHNQYWENYLSNHIVESRVSYEVIWEKHIHHYILEHCKETHYDLIVKTGRRSEAFFHTPTDWQLFRHSHTPVYSVNLEKEQANKSVLVALDLMTKREEKQALNRKLLETGFQLATQANADLHCCYAIEISRLLKDMDLIDVDQEVKSLEPKAREAAANFMDVYDLDDQNLHIQEGKVSTVITNLSRDLKVGCVIVGSMGRSGIAGKLMGNTAEAVIQHAKTDLLIISPE